MLHLFRQAENKKHNAHAVFAKKESSCQRRRASRLKSFPLDEDLSHLENKLIISWSRRNSISIREFKLDASLRWHDDSFLAKMAWELEEYGIPQ